MVRLFKYLSYFALVLVFLVGLLALFSRTVTFKEWLKRKAISLALESINGEIEIGELRGNLFTHLEIHDFSIKTTHAPVLEIQRVVIRYQPLGLLRKSLTLSELTIEAPTLTLSQDAASAWNFQELVASKDSTLRASEESDSGFEWRIDAPNIRLSSGQLTLTRQAGATEARTTTVSELYSQFGLGYDVHQANLNLADLSFASTNPDLVVQTVRSNLNYAPDVLKADAFEIETEASKLVSQLELRNLDRPELDLRLRGQPISLDEVRQMIPQLNLYGDTRLEITARGSLADLGLDARLGIGQSETSVQGRLQLENEPFGYDLRGSITNLNLAAFTERPDLDSDLHLRFQVSGQGVQLNAMDSEITVEFDTSRALGKRIDRSQLVCTIKNDSLRFRLDANAEGAKTSISGNLSIDRGDIFSYDLSGAVENFDLGRFVDRGISSDLNLHFDLQGRGLDYDSMRARLTAGFHSSHIAEVAVDSAYLDSKLEGGLLNLQRLSVSSPVGKLSAEGKLSITRVEQLRADADFENLAFLADVVPLDSIRGTGQLTATASGPVDSLGIHADLKLSRVGANDLFAEALTVSGAGSYSVRGYDFQATGQATNATAGLRNLDADFSVRLRDSVATIDAQVRRGTEMSLAGRGSLRIETAGSTIEIETLEASYSDYEWRLTNETPVVRLTEDGVVISPMMFVSVDQRFDLYGRFAPEGPSDLRLKIENLELASYASLLGPKTEAGGRFNFDLGFTGSLTRPRFVGRFELHNGTYLDISFHKFSGDFDIDDNSVDWLWIFSKTEKDSLVETSGHLPITLQLQPFEHTLVDDQPLELKLNARGLDLSLLQGFTKSVTNIQGKLVADIVLNNTFADLRGSGPIRLVDAAFDISQLGTKYRKANLALLLRDQELVIRDFRMNSGGGVLNLVEGGLSLSREKLEDFKARFNANNFELMNNEKMQARVKGQIELSGSVQAPYFSGDLTINESRIYYPAWFEDEAVVQLTSKPFFVIAEDSVEFDSSGALRFQKADTRPENNFTDSEFYQNLRGELGLNFPRNSWIRSQDTNIEVTGDIVAVKEQGPDMGLFGSFSTKRGHYELLGNRFQIKRGDMVFYGETVPNPEVNIEAVYEFVDSSGDDPQKHEFKVSVTGTLYSPEFRFSLDGKVAEQEDVISVLVFGRTSEDLPVGQRSSVSGNSGLDDKAAGFLTGQVLKTLSGTLGRELSLDVIQIESGKNLEETRLRVGKYITPEVFVSVSQDFGAEGNQKVDLEYEIPRKILFFNFLLQASRERRGDTGLDVIWKIEW